MQRPCRDCPEGLKQESSYKDETGAIRLCATHALKAGTYKMRYPCRDCPEGAKREAHFVDETGASNKLCADHARIAGTHEVRNPCRDCQEGAKLQANYKDETGASSKLCAKHAVLAGTHVEIQPGASRIACECFDRLETLLKITLPHVHYDSQGNVTGEEVRGLVPGSKCRPDSYQDNSNTVWLFHGSYYHGFPPGHPKHETFGVGDQWGPDLWEATVEQMKLYVKCGYVVNYIMEHEYQETRVRRFPRALGTVVHRFEL